MDRENERIGLQKIIDKTIEDMARDEGDPFDLDHVNLAEIACRTELARSLRTRPKKAW